MWSSSRVARIGLVLAALAFGPVLSACSGFVPVYSDAGLGPQRISVTYGKAGNRLEQIIYQDLALKLGKAPEGAQHVPQVLVSASSSVRQLTSQTIANPRTAYQAVVNAIVSVIDDDGKVLGQASRSTTADFTYGPQAFANSEAANEAAERGAKALADTIRLQVLAALAKK
jgi:hypothetical protein